jgi:F-type H+-transporting ATPase subunit b
VRYRNRLVVAGLLVALMALLGMSGVAHAGTTGTTEPEAVVDEGDDNGVSIEDELDPEGAEHENEAELSEIGECVEQSVAEGLDPDECVEAPNPILPATNELIWGGISFLIVLIALWKLALPPVRKMMSDRAEKIRTELDEADTAKSQAEDVLADYRAKLADAKTESNRIIEEARQTADQLRADLAARAEAEIAETRQRAQADIESAKVQAISDLKAEVASIAIGAAEVVVRKNLDEATQTQLIEDYINQVAADR